MIKNLSAMLTTAMLLSGCLRPAHTSTDNEAAAQLKEEANATFNLKEATANIAPNEIDANFNEVISSKLTINVCLQDKRSLEAVIGHSFHIEGGDTPKDIKTNINGCLSWTEVIAQNPYANQKFVAQERKIKATGVHSGTRTLRFGYNPWVAPKQYFVDLNFQSAAIASENLVTVEKSREALAGIIDGQPVKIPAWPDAFSLQVLDVGVSSQSRRLKIHGELTPTIYSIGTNGYNPRVLTSGVFDYNMYFVVDSPQGKFIVYELHSKAPIKMSEFKLRFDEVVDIPQEKRQGELKLALELLPSEAPSSLVSYHGIYTLGESANVTGTFSPRLVSGLNNVSKDFDIMSFLNGAIKQDGSKIKFADSKTTTILATGEELQNLNLTPTSSFSIDETRYGLTVTTDVQSQNQNQQFTDRELRFQVCVQNATGPLIGQTFEIKSFTGAPISPITTTIANRGCLMWSETFKNLSYYSRQAPQEGAISIIHGSSTIKIPVAIDPLNDAVPFYNLNIPGVRKEYDVVKENLKDRKINLLLNSFTLVSKSDLLLSVAPDLSADSAMIFNFDLPKVTVERSDREGKPQNEQLRDGYYLLRVGLQKDFIDRLETKDCETKHMVSGKMDGCEREHVTTAQRIVHFSGGHIQGASLNLLFSDWRFLNLSNNILVELYPIDYSKFSTQNLEQQVDSFNRDFSGQIKSQDSIDKFNSLIDKNSGLYTKTNFIGQVVPRDPTQDPSLFVNDQSYFQQNCGEMSKTDLAAPINPEDLRPEVAKFRLGMCHLSQVTVEDLMKKEKVQLENVVAKRERHFDYNQFAKSTASDLILLKPDASLPEFDKSLNLVLPAPQKSVSNAGSFINALNAFTPDYTKTFYSCPRQEHEGEAGCILNAPTPFFENPHPETLMLQDRDSNLANYMPKVSLESLYDLTTYRPDVEGTPSRLNAQKNFAYRMCSFWFKNYLPKQKKNYKEIYHSGLGGETLQWISGALGSDEASFAEEFTQDCLLETFKNPNSVFIFERKVPVYRFEQQQDTLPQNNFLIEIGTGNSISSSLTNSRTSSSTTSFNPLTFLSLVPEVGSILAQISPIQHTLSWTESVTNSDSVGIGGETNALLRFMVDEETLPLSLQEHDSCMNIRLNPYFVKSAHLISRLGPVGKNMTPQMQADKIQFLTRGILICNGEKSVAPVSYMQKYYYLSQFIWTNANRGYDIRVNPYLFKLRGTNELLDFFAMTRAKSTNDLTPNHNLQMDIDERMKNYQVPYRQPSFPDVISVD